MPSLFFCSWPEFLARFRDDCQCPNSLLFAGTPMSFKKMGAGAFECFNRTPQNHRSEELIGAVKSGEFFLQAFQFG